jgi:hypothetical protein
LLPESFQKHQLSLEVQAGHENAIFYHALMSKYILGIQVHEKRSEKYHHILDMTACIHEMLEKLHV